MAPHMTTEWNADAYHRVSDPQFTWGMVVLARVIFAGDETVIDTGCGSGRVSAELAARVPRGRVIGLDRSRQMASAARETARRHAAANLHVVVADLSALPVAQRADLVFSTATFHWILDHDALFAEIHHALAPGGRLVAQCGGAGNLARIHARAHAMMQSREWSAHFASWREPWEFASAETTTARLRRAGFGDIQAWLEPAPTAFVDGHAFATFTATVVLRPHLACLPTDAMRAQFVGELTEQFAADDPPFVLDYVRLNISATRAPTVVR
jgi:trans-aconitate 2-methyltransferase